MSNEAAIITPKPKRYHPAIVALHWIILILIFATAFFAMGGEGGREGSISIAGFQPIAIHMVLGIIVLVLLIIRLFIRIFSKRPAWASTGNRFLDIIGELTHWALYFFTFAIVITGLILALQANRLARTFGIGSNTPPQFQPGQFPPPNGRQFQPRPFPRSGEGGEGFRGEGGFFLGAFHGLSWALLLLLIFFHASAALYHQFIVKDNLFGRMWFGKRYE
jgi:cytochrome b561